MGRGQSILQGRKMCVILAKPKDHVTIRADQQGSQLVHSGCVHSKNVFEDISVSTETSMVYNIFFVVL